MKYFLMALILFLIFGCTKAKKIWDNESPPPKSFSGYWIKYIKVGTPKGTVSYKEKYTILNGVKDGILTTYNDQGKIDSELNYLQNKLHGVSKYWYNYEKGILQSKSNYKLGLLNGLSASWWPSGKLKSKGIYLNGKKMNGTFFGMGVDENGKFVSLILFYKNGQQIINKNTVIHAK